MCGSGFSSGHHEQGCGGSGFQLWPGRRHTTLKFCGGPTNILVSFSSVIEVSFLEYKHQIISRVSRLRKTHLCPVSIERNASRKTHWTKSPRIGFSASSTPHLPIIVLVPGEILAINSAIALQLRSPEIISVPLKSLTSYTPELKSREGIQITD